MPALTTTNPLLKKGGLLKINVYKLQICKFNSLTGFDEETVFFSKNVYCCRGKSKSDVFSTIKYKHNCFTLASSVNSHNKSFQLSFITERPRIRLNCFKYLGPKLLSVSQKLLKT